MHVKNISRLWVLMGLLTLVGPSVASEITPLKQAVKSVVSVMPEWPGRPPNLAEPEGSGVVTGDGTIIITADHVLGPYAAGPDISVRIRDHDGNIVSARVIARDKATDIAVLKIETAMQPFADNDEALAIGDEVCAIGNAFGIGLSLTCGRVSALHRSGTGFNAIEDFIQTDAAVNPGMSGGALVDRAGRFVGMLSAIFTKQSDANIGVNLAIDRSLVIPVVSALLSEGKFSPRVSGLVFRPVPPKGEIGREGLLVVKVRSQSPGETAGLQEGDIVYQLDDRRVRSVAQWLASLAIKPVGEALITGVRDGKAMTWQLKD